MDARRRECLRAMGIDLWVSRDAVAAPDGLPEAQDRAPAPGNASAAPWIASAEGAPAQPVSPVSKDHAAGPGAAPVADVVADPVADPVVGSVVAPAAADLGADRAAGLDWDALRATVATCQACALHPTRTQTVFGVGDPNARLLVIGEAPGADEDRKGEPFVGRAGQLLTAMLAAIGLAREQVYIANIIKCRPPGNRDPHPEEAAACRPYLHRQIELIRPALILSVGRISAQQLLGTDEAVGRLRGRVHRFDPGDIPLIVTYHPAYLLRRPLEKAKAWQDLQAVHRALHAETPSS